MKPFLKLISMIAMALVIVPSIVYFGGMMSHDAVKWTALAGTVAWFATTPFWMGREIEVDADAVEI
ncbi:MAG: hypothetical protein ACF8CQ_06885 [Rhodopirellula sp. JB044]|uniref:hypothetical protein n=1 Tax=Rhodopirellula sp. JB044 TaxID=3342844 RepID=UPI00370CE5A0